MTLRSHRYAHQPATATPRSPPIPRGSRCSSQSRAVWPPIRSSTCSSPMNQMEHRRRTAELSSGLGAPATGRCAFCVVEVHAEQVDDAASAVGHGLAVGADLVSRFGGRALSAASVVSRISPWESLFSSVRENPSSTGRQSSPRTPNRPAGVQAPRRRRPSCGGKQTHRRSPTPRP